MANTRRGEWGGAKAATASAGARKSVTKSTRLRDDDERPTREDANDASTTASARKRVREDEMHALVRAFEDAGAWIEAMSRRREGGDC